MSTIIRNGRVIDPANERDEVADLAIADGRISDLSAVRDPQSAIDEIEASNLIVAPGLIDMHVHLREPGFSHKETIDSGAHAAAAGGFSNNFFMPKPLPTAGTPTTLTWIANHVREQAL